MIAVLFDEQLILENCALGSLAAFVDNGIQFTEDELCGIASCCLLGLRECSDHGILFKVAFQYSFEFLGHPTKSSVPF